MALNRTSIWEQFIKSHFIRQFINEAKDFSKIYIIHCDDNSQYTKIIGMNKDGQFDSYQPIFA